MDEPTRTAYLEKQLRMLKQKEADAKRIAEYEDRLKNENLKTFKDAPDEISEIYVIKSSCEYVEISWDAPEDNNSKIKTYHVYLSSVSLRNL
jgi:hypothetical protein